MPTINIADTFGRIFATVEVRSFSLDRSLAMHRTMTHDAKGWSVTHVRTGASIVDGVPLRDAERILDASAFAYGKELRRIQFAAKPLAKSIKPGIASVIRATMGNRSPAWAMNA